VLDFQPMTQSLRREFPGGVPRQIERLRNRRTQERIAQRIEHKRERALGDVMLFMADRQLGHEAADGIEDWVQRISVPGQDHPGGESAGAFLAKGVEALIDDHASVGLARAGAFHGVRNAAVHRVGDRFRELAL